jgi:hypothetical protein
MCGKKNGNIFANYPRIFDFVHVARTINSIVIFKPNNIHSVFNKYGKLSLFIASSKNNNIKILCTYPYMVERQPLQRQTFIIEYKNYGGQMFNTYYYAKAFIFFEFFRIILVIV